MHEDARSQRQIRPTVSAGWGAAWMAECLHLNVSVAAADIQIDTPPCAQLRQARRQLAAPCAPVQAREVHENPVLAATDGRQTVCAKRARIP